MNAATTIPDRCRHGMIALLGWLAIGLVPAKPAAAEVRPSWECLPADTAVLVRVPDARAFIDIIRTRTKFGAVVMSPDRVRGLAQIAAESLGRGAKGAGTDVADLVAKGLGRFGLSTEDLTATVSGDFGAGLVMHEASGEAPTTPILLAWSDTHDLAVASRLFDGFGRLVEEAIEREGDREFPPKRTDLAIAGTPVIHLEAPLVDDDKKFGAAHVLLARIEGRLLAAAAVAASRANIKLQVEGAGGLQIDTEVPKTDKTPEEIEREAAGVAEELRATFERFLARHSEAGGDSPMADLVNTPAIKAAMPAGLPLVELFANPDVALAAMGEAATKVRNNLLPMGLDTIGPIAWRQSIDGDVWRSNVFASLPGPRHGFMRLLDEKADAPEVPPFVTREAVGFQQISLDLGKAYALLREAALGGDEPPPGNGFGTAEMSCQSMLGVELPALLSAFGTHHWIVSYPPKIEEMIAHARKVRAAGGPAAVAEPPPNPSPSAIVWRVNDEAVFAKLLQVAAPAAGQQVAEEQGFRSVRFPGGAAVFLGRGHLVVAAGEGVPEKMIAAIRNPPGDDEAFRTSDAVGRAREMLPPSPAGVYGISDDSRTAGLFGLVVAAIRATQPEDVAEDSREYLVKLQALLPTADEMRGMLGAAATLWQSDDRGVLMRSARHLPAP